MPYIEIKTREKINRGLALTLVEKGTITAVVTTGTITPSAKKYLMRLELPGRRIFLRASL
jgi:hypothetical protein